MTDLEKIIRDEIEKVSVKLGDEVCPRLSPSWEGTDRQCFDIGFERASELLLPVLMKAVEQRDVELKKYHNEYLSDPLCSEIVEADTRACNDQLITLLKGET